MKGSSCSHRPPDRENLDDPWGPFLGPHPCYSEERGSCKEKQGEVVRRNEEGLEVEPHNNCGLEVQAEKMNC